MTQNPNGNSNEEYQPAKTITLSQEQKKARLRRSWLIAGALLAFVILVFAVTIVRIDANLEKQKQSRQHNGMNRLLLWPGASVNNVV